MRIRREARTAAAMALMALMALAPGAFAQEDPSAVDQYSADCDGATASADCNRSPGNLSGSGDPRSGGGAGGGGGPSGGAGSGPGSAEFDALRERLTRSGALDAPGFSNLLKSFRGLEGENPALSVDGRESEDAAARSAASRDGGGDSDRTGLLLMVLALSTLAVTGLGVAFKRRRDGLAVRQ